MPDTPLNSQWFYSTNGKDYGPVTWSIIESMVQDDRLSREDLVLQAGETTHLRIADVMQMMSATGVFQRPQSVATETVPPTTAPTSTLPLVASTDRESSQPIWSGPIEVLGQEAEPDEYRVEEPAILPPLEQFTPSPPEPIAAKTKRKVRSISSVQSVGEVTRTDAVLALNPQRLIFSLQLSGLWAIGSSLMWILGSQLGLRMLPLVTFLTCCLLLVYYTILAATVSHMIAEESETRRPPTWFEGWQFALERAAPLVLGPLFVGLGAGSLIAVGGTVIHTVSHLQTMGPLFGGILLFPTFLIVMAVLLLMLCGTIIPVIMGIEDCGPSEAVKIWTDRGRQGSMQLFLDCVRVLSSITPMLLLSLVLTLIALTSATSLTIDWNSLIPLTINVPNILIAGSVGLIAATWLAFALVLVVTSLTKLLLPGVSQE